MAHADRKHFGAGMKGAGALAEADTADIPDSLVLSNRDKSRHGDERGLDGKAVQTDQCRDHAANRRLED